MLTHLHTDQPEDSTAPPTAKSPSRPDAGTYRPSRLGDREAGGVNYFLAGDTSYTEALLK